jgi:hypothetical protein
MIFITLALYAEVTRSTTLYAEALEASPLYAEVTRSTTLYAEALEAQL